MRGRPVSSGSTCPVQRSPSPEPASGAVRSACGTCDAMPRGWRGFPPRRSTSSWRTCASWTCPTPRARSGRRPGSSVPAGVSSSPSPIPASTGTIGRRGSLSASSTRSRSGGRCGVPGRGGARGPMGGRAGPDLHDEIVPPNAHAVRRLPGPGRIPGPAGRRTDAVGGVPPAERVRPLPRGDPAAPGGRGGATRRPAPVPRIGADHRTGVAKVGTYSGESRPTIGIRCPHARHRFSPSRFQDWIVNP